MSNPEKKFPAVKTPVTTTQMLAAVRAAWPAGSTPAVDLAVAHSALETGWWKACWNWNLGNAKATPGEPHCYYPAGEELQPAYAEQLRAASPSLVTIIGPSKIAGLVSVNFRPEHPMCRFRSFPSLAEALLDHLNMLREDFPASWAALQTGDPDLYVAALKQERYFTAAEGPYTAGVAGCLAMVRQQAALPATAAHGYEFRAVIPGEPADGRLLRIADYLVHLGNKSRVLLEPGAEGAPWTCMVFLRAVVWHACLAPEDRTSVRIGGLTFGKYGDDEDRSILGSLLYPSGGFVDGRHGKSLELAAGAMFWQSAPAGGNDHVGIIRAWRVRPDGAVDVDTFEGGQTPVHCGAFTRTWRKRADGRWDNTGKSGSPAAGNAVIQGLAYCDAWPLRLAPEAYDGAADRLRDAIDVGRALVRELPASERETLEPPEE